MAFQSSSETSTALPRFETIAIGWCDSIVSSTKLKSPSLALDIGTIFTGKFRCTISGTTISSFNFIRSQQRDLHISKLNCRRASYNSNAAAIPTFNDSTPAQRGICTCRSLIAAKSADKPAPSFPSRIKLGRCQSTSQ